MKTIEISATQVLVSEESGVDENGPTFRVWSCTPDQAEKHLPTWEQPTSAATGTRLSPGDADAIRDAANESRKQRDS